MIALNTIIKVWKHRTWSMRLLDLTTECMMIMMFWVAMSFCSVVDSCQYFWAVHLLKHISHNIMEEIWVIFKISLFYRGSNDTSCLLLEEKLRSYSGLVDDRSPDAVNNYAKSSLTLAAHCKSGKGVHFMYKGWIKSSGNSSIVLKLLYYLR